jgi:hypothetical protein
MNTNEQSEQLEWQKQEIREEYIQQDVQQKTDESQKDFNRLFGVDG